MSTYCFIPPPPVSFTSFTILDLVTKSWGGEYNAPDHGIYQFSNGRRFDSSDRGNSGIYNSNLGPQAVETT